MSGQGPSRPSDDNAALEKLRATISTPRAWGMTERLVPDSLQRDPFSDYIKEVQYRNYKIASLLAEGKRVLDIACGSGYGSSLLAESGATEVIGVDISHQAIQYATMRYPGRNINYVTCDAMTYSDGGEFDLIVSFETIEHLPKPQLFMKRLSTLATENGVLLVSAPVGETRHIDPYHLHRFSEDGIHKLLTSSGFTPLLSRSDPFVLSLQTLYTLARSYPEASPLTISELVCSSRPWWLIADCLFSGGLRFSQHLVVAQRCRSSP